MEVARKLRGRSGAKASSRIPHRGIYFASPLACFIFSFFRCFFDSSPLGVDVPDSAGEAAAWGSTCERLRFVSLDLGVAVPDLACGVAGLGWS